MEFTSASQLLVSTMADTKLPLSRGGKSVLVIVVHRIFNSRGSCNDRHAHGTRLMITRKRVCQRMRGLKQLVMKKMWKTSEQNTARPQQRFKNEDDHQIN